MNTRKLIAAGVIGLIVGWYLGMAEGMEMERLDREGRP